MGVALPVSIPRPMVENHVQQEAEIAEPCEFEAGEPRLAPIYRTVPTTVMLRWRLTQAQFDDFWDWFENDLFAGSLPMDVSIAEQGSADAVTVEAMALSTPDETQLPGGRWLVDLPVVTGVPFDDGIAPAGPCIDETFGTGLAAYSAASGTDEAFSVSSGVLSIEQGGPNLSEQRRSFSARTVVTVSFKFRLTSLGNDDACIFRLFSGGVQAMSFYPRRELALSAGVGSPHYAIGIAAALGGVTPVTALAVDTDYQFELEIIAGADNSTLVITRISDSTVVVNNNPSGDLEGAMPDIDALGFLVDDGGSNFSETRYWDIHICAAGA